MTAVRFSFGSRPAITAGGARELAGLLHAHGSSDENALAGKLLGPIETHDRLIADVELTQPEMTELLTVLNEQAARHRIPSDSLYRLRTELEAAIEH